MPNGPLGIKLPNGSASGLKRNFNSARIVFIRFLSLQLRPNASLIPSVIARESGRSSIRERRCLLDTPLLVRDIADACSRGMTAGVCGLSPRTLLWAAAITTTDIQRYVVRISADDSTPSLTKFFASQ